MRARWRLLVVAAAAVAVVAVLVVRHEREKPGYLDVDPQANWTSVDWAVDRAKVNLDGPWHGPPPTRADVRYAFAGMYDDVRIRRLPSDVVPAKFLLTAPDDPTGVCLYVRYLDPKSKKEILAFPVPPPC